MSPVVAMKNDNIHAMFLLCVFDKPYTTTTNDDIKQVNAVNVHPKYMHHQGRTHQSVIGAQWLLGLSLMVMLLLLLLIRVMLLMLILFRFRYVFVFVLLLPLLLLVLLL